MKKTKLISTLFIAVVLLAAGILVIVYNDAFLKVLAICTGIISVYYGARALFSIPKWKIQGVSRTLGLIKGILLTVFGVFAIISPLVAAETVFSVVMYILAADLAFSAFVSIENAIAVKKLSSEFSVKGLLLEAGLSLVIAIILFTSPAAILTTAVKVIGGILIGIGAGLAFWQIRLASLSD